MQAYLLEVRVELAHSAALPHYSYRRREKQTQEIQSTFQDPSRDGGSFLMASVTLVARSSGSFAEEAAKYFGPGVVVPIPWQIFVEYQLDPGPRADIFPGGRRPDND